MTIKEKYPLVCKWIESLRPTSIKILPTGIDVNFAGRDSMKMTFIEMEMLENNKRNEQK